MFLCPFANYVEPIPWPQKLSQTMCFHKTQLGLDRRTLAISNADKKIKHTVSMPHVKQAKINLFFLPPCLHYLL